MHASSLDKPALYCILNLMSDDLMTQAQAAVKASDLPAEEIARRADVSERWIYLLKAGELTNPSIRRLERVIKAIADAPKRKRAA